MLFVINPNSIKKLLEIEVSKITGLKEEDIKQKVQSRVLDQTKRKRSFKTFRTLKEMPQKAWLPQIGFVSLRGKWLQNKHKHKCKKKKEGVDVQGKMLVL